MALITFKNFKGDLFGGITAGIVALPLALAFGIQAFGGINDPQASSMGALAGLVGATILGFFAALFGGTHSQISGPTGPMTVITASLVSGAWAAGGGNFAHVVLAMSMAGIFCGLFQILFGIMKIGKYVRFIPFSVLSGFMSGIGIIIILQQIYPLIGLKSPVLVVDMIRQFGERAKDITTFTPLLLGMGTIFIIYAFPYITKKIPATLVALIVMTIVSLFTGLPEKMTIGDIPASLPTPFFAKLDLTGINWMQVVVQAIVPGLTLAGLGSIDTLLTSVVADNITKTKHDSNQELIGQGIGNALAGLFCGIAGAGATMRTVVNVKSGGRTQLSGMIHALLLLAILLGLGALVKYVPLSVLAGILITVGLGIIDFKGFRDLARVPKSDAFVLLVVLFMTVFVDLLTAVGIGMVISCVLFMKQMSDAMETTSKSEELEDIDKLQPWDGEESIPDELHHLIYIQRIDGPMFFGSVAGFQRVMSQVPKHARYCIIRMRRVSFMDQSGIVALETALEDLNAQGTEVIMTHLREQPLKMMKKGKIVPRLIKEDHLFPKFLDGVNYIIQKENCEMKGGKLVCEL